jgi:hypothetical protein
LQLDEDKRVQKGMYTPTVMHPISVQEDLRHNRDCSLSVLVLVVEVKGVAGGERGSGADRGGRYHVYREKERWKLGRSDMTY